MRIHASFQALCHRCGGRFGWRGRMLDMPPCPRCGQVMSAEEKRRAQRKMEAAAQQAALQRLTRGMAQGGVRIAER